MSDQESAELQKRIELGAMLCGAAAAALQVTFHAGGYSRPTDAQHELMVKAFTKRIEALVLEDADPETARVAITEHVQRTVLIVLGPAPIASSLN